MCDKTGTLTKNALTLVAVCCREQATYFYGHIATEGGKVEATLT